MLNLSFIIDGYSIYVGLLIMPLSIDLNYKTFVYSKYFFLLAY